MQTQTVVVKNKLITQRFFDTLERQLVNFPKIQLSRVQGELRREKEARVAAELRTTEAKKGHFEMQQKINQLEAQAK